MKGRVYVFKNEMKNTGKPSLTRKMRDDKEKIWEDGKNKQPRTNYCVESRTKKWTNNFYGLIIFISKKKKKLSLTYIL